MSSQLEDAFNEAVEQRTAELRAALEFYANADNYVGGEVGWWADARGGEHRWCMDFGSIARSALRHREGYAAKEQKPALTRWETKQIEGMERETLIAHADRLNDVAEILRHVRPVDLPKELWGARDGAADDTLEIAALLRRIAA